MNEKTPLIRLAKREDMPKSKIWLIRAAAFLLAIVLGGLVFFIAGTNPITAYGAILSSSLGKPPASNRLSRSRCRCWVLRWLWHHALQCASGISAAKDRSRWVRLRRASSH